MIPLQKRGFPSLPYEGNKLHVGDEELPFFDLLKITHFPFPLRKSVAESRVSRSVDGVQEIR